MQFAVSMIIKWIVDGAAASGSETIKYKATAEKRMDADESDDNGERIQIENSCNSTQQTFSLKTHVFL